MMMRINIHPFIFSLCLAGFLLSGGAYSHAQDHGHSHEEQAELSPEEKKGRKALIEMEKYTAELLNGLTPDQAQYIYEIRVNFGIIRSIREAKGQVGDAVKACSANNPELEEPITARYQAWNQGVTEQLSSTDHSLKDAIKRQSFRPVARVHKLLDKIDKAFEERDSQVEKIPVTSIEACQRLLDSMDETQEQMESLLEETSNALTSLSIMPRQVGTPSEEEAP